MCSVHFTTDVHRMYLSWCIKKIFSFSLKENPKKYRLQMLMYALCSLCYEIRTVIYLVVLSNILFNTFAYWCLGYVMTYPSQQILKSMLTKAQQNKNLWTLWIYTQTKLKKEYTNPNLLYYYNRLYCKYYQMFNIQYLLIFPLPLAPSGDKGV